jgi:hypothetical protein
MLTELSPALALGVAALGRARRAWLGPALALSGALAMAVNASGVFASRSPSAQAVYAVGDAREAMEAWRWPPLAWLGSGRSSDVRRPRRGSWRGRPRPGARPSGRSAPR